MVKISAQSGVVYWSYCPPNLPKWAQLGPEPNNCLFLLGKVENNKYPEVESWHPEGRWMVLLQDL